MWISRFWRRGGAQARVEIRRAPASGPTPNSRFLSGNALVPPGMGADEWRLVMLDAVLLVVGCGFFVAAILYTVGCDRI